MLQTLFNKLSKETYIYHRNIEGRNFKMVSACVSERPRKHYFMSEACKTPLCQLREEDLALLPLLPARFYKRRTRAVSLPRWTATNFCECCNLFPVLAAGLHVRMLAHVSVRGGARVRRRRGGGVTDDMETGEKSSSAVSLLNPASDRTHDKLARLTEGHSTKCNKF